MMTKTLLHIGPLWCWMDRLSYFSSWMEAEASEGMEEGVMA